MTLNLNNIDEKRVYNLTQLRKNSRKRPNKKAGKKQPRPCDEDQLSVINPAPDCAKKKNSRLSLQLQFLLPNRY